MSEFRPLPFLGNPHVQTVLGSLLQDRAYAHATVPRRVPLPDGDVLVAHDSRPSRWTPADPIALLVHGLAGSHRSGHVQRLAAFLLPHRIRVIRVDLRGAGAGAALARRTYHGGCSDDLRAVAEEIARWSPASPLFLVGMSLGGNVVLKLAGEAAERPLHNLACVAAVAPPIDLLRCSALISLPRNRFYDSFFVRNLVAQVRRQQRFFPDVPRIGFPRKLTLRGFDDLYTAPRGGFADALDYYRRASALPLLDRIRVPTFVLTSRDDPFVDVAPFEELQQSTALEVHIAQRGGHLGFLGWDGRGGFRWAERCVVDWLLAQRL